MNESTGEEFNVTVELSFRVRAANEVAAHAQAQSTMHERDRIAHLDGYHVDAISVTGVDAAVRTDRRSGLSARAEGGSVAVGNVHGSVVVGDYNRL